LRDLTKGPIPGHILAMAAPMAVGMLVQTLYYLVDLYFVSRLGDVALAGVSAAANVFLIVMALTQVLGVATVALISHAAGRNDRPEANHLFNQSLALAGGLAALTLAGGYGLGSAYMGSVGADAATAAAGTTYLRWYVPGMALQFATVAMGSALRGTGIVKPTMVVQMGTVAFNVVLAPVLIAGWGTGRPLGVAGAGLATSLSIAGGVALLGFYFVKLERYVGFDPAHWRPDLATWRRMLGIGLPAGGEFALMFVYVGVIYWIIRDFGAAAQAGFGLGSRVMQAIFLPAMAIAFATPAVAGQNFGARRGDRVRGTFHAAALIGGTIMFALTLLCQWRPDLLLRPFTPDADVVAVSRDFLRIISWNFVAVGFIFTCSGMFQALGNTWPALISMTTRVVTFAVPAVWLAGQSGFELAQVWYLSVVTVALQALVSWLLLRVQLSRRLRFAAAAPAPAPAPVSG